MSAPYRLTVQCDDAGEIEAKTGQNVFVFGADGATAPETLRPKDRVVRTIWRETPKFSKRRPPKGISVIEFRLGRIKLSGTVTDGAPSPVDAGDEATLTRGSFFKTMPIPANFGAGHRWRNDEPCAAPARQRQAVSVA
jgi:hypothetical protein